MKMEYKTSEKRTDWSVIVLFSILLSIVIIISAVTVVHFHNSDKSTEELEDAMYDNGFTITFTQSTGYSKYLSVEAGRDVRIDDGWVLIYDATRNHDLMYAIPMDNILQIEVK